MTHCDCLLFCAIEILLLTYLLIYLLTLHQSDKSSTKWSAEFSRSNIHETAVQSHYSKERWAVAVLNTNKVIAVTRYVGGSKRNTIVEMGKNPNPARTNRTRTQCIGSYSVLSLNEIVDTFTHSIVNKARLLYLG